MDNVFWIRSLFRAIFMDFIVENLLFMGRVEWWHGLFLLMN
jgi:hypothetical protein